MRFVLQNTKNYHRLDICYIKVLEELNIKYEIVDTQTDLAYRTSVGCIIEINTLEQLNQISDNIQWSLIYNDIHDESLFPKDKYPNIRAIEIYDYYRE